MSRKKSKHQRSRARLGKLSPVSLVGSLCVGSAWCYREVEPESWQSKGKKPKPRVN